MRRVIFALGIVMGVHGAADVHAQSVDGQWCHSDGRRMNIEGGELTTPNGARIQGNNARQSFRHAAPGGARSTCRCRASIN